VAGIRLDKTKEGIAMRNSITLFKIIVCAVMVTTISHPARAADEVAAARSLGKAFAGTARKTTPAVVFIRVEKTLRQRVPHAQRRYNDPSEFFGEELWRRFFEEGLGQQYRQFKQQGA